jgi:Peptidase A4 family
MRQLLVRLATLLAGATVLAAPAAASAPLTFAPAHHAVVAHGFNINGYNWGGYAATGSGFTSISASWRQPSATCNSRNDLYAPWVGIDGYGSSTVEQTGVATDCSSGRPVNEPWYEMYPRSPVYLNTGSYPVAAGDTITASVTYAGSSRYTLSLRDTTKGWTFTTTQTLSSRRLSAEVIIESPTGAYPNFGTISFSGATVNGNSFSSYSPTALDPSNGVYEAHTGALSGGNFSIAYEHE